MRIECKVLFVLQFTLYYKMKGNKPDFHSAMAGPEANEFYDTFLDKLRKDYDTDKIKGELYLDITIFFTNNHFLTIVQDNKNIGEKRELFKTALGLPK